MQVKKKTGMAETTLTRRSFLQTALSLGGLALGGRIWGQAAADKLPPPLPADRLDGPPIVSARGWAIAEGGTGRLLWGGRESAELVMASTTKIMTAWLVLRLAADNPKVLDEELVVSPQAAK